MTSPIFKTGSARRIAALCLFAFSVLLLVSSSRPWATAQAVWRVEIKEGDTASSSLSINNHCAAPHNFRVTNKFKSLRLDQPTDSVLIEASGSKRIAATFDARGLKSKVYGGKVDIECLDCKKEQGCTQDHDELAIEMNVIKSATAPANSISKLDATSSSSGNPLLTVNKHHEPNQSAGSWQIGVPITYVIQIANSGAPNSHITVADALPAGFIFVSATYSTASGATGPSGPAGPLASSPFGPFSIPQGAQVEIRVIGYFTTSGSKDNTATASATDGNGNPLPVSSSTTNPTNVGTDSVFVPPSATLPNIAVTKSVTPTSSSLPGTMHYTIKVANTTATDVYLGGIARLRDDMSVNSVPLNWTITAPTCNATGGAVCPDMPATVGNNSAQILFPYDAIGGPPANDAGFLPANSSYTIAFDVTLSRTVTCGSATAQFFNTATLEFLNGWADSIPSDNSSQVSTNINTGLTTACAGGTAGPSIVKTQLDPSGAPSNNATWNTNVRYRIEISNPTSAAVSIPLTDMVYKSAGTPTFTATVTSGPSCTGCTSLSPPALSTPTVNADSQAFTLWTATATVPSMSASQKAVIEYTAVYKPVCETDTRDDIITNWIYGGSSALSQTVSSKLDEWDPCALKAQKTDVTGGPIIFGQPHSYEVVYQNLSATPMSLFVRDDLSIKSNRYGVFSVDSVSSCSVTAGTVTVPAGHPANVVGATATFQAAGWRGVKLINEYLAFGPTSTLKCQVTVTAHQPTDSNAHCQGADNPMLVNSAYIDPNSFNENSSAPPKFYSSVETPLPLCRNLIVTKTANANSFGPGQPVDYTITVENIGDDPVSSFQLQDTIQLPLTLVPTGTQVSQCTPPGDCTTQPNVSGGNQVKVGYGPLQPNHHPVSFIVHAVAPQAGGSYPNVAVGSFLAGGNFYFQGDASHFLQSEENIQVLTPVLSKSFDPAQIAPNGTSTLTFNITNTNSDPKQTNINFSDALPPGLQIVSVISNGCSGNVTTSNNGHTVTLTGGQLVGSNADGSGKHTCQISVQVKASGECRVYENKQANFLEVKNLDVSNINEHLDVVGCPTRPPTLTKFYKPATIPVNGTTDLAFTITNSTGDPKQTGIAFSDTLPPGLQIVSVVSSGCGGTVAISADHQTVTLSGGQLVGSNADGSGQHSCQIIIKVRVTDKCGTYPNTEKNFSDVKNLDISGVNAQLTVGDCPSGGLVIQKDVKGAPQGFTGQFNFLVQCSTPNGFYQQAVTVNWPTPGSTTLPDVPAGSKCTVTEGPEPSSLPAHYNWSGLPVYSANGGLVSIGPLGAHLTVTDTMSPCNDTGQVTITKIVKGLPKDYIGVFQGTLSCWVSNNLVTYPVTLTSPNGLTATVGNIPLGSVCTFQETGQPPLTGDLVWNQPLYSTEFGAVTLSGECCQQITVTNEARHCCTQTGSSGPGTSQNESGYGPVKTPAPTKPTSGAGKNIRKTSP